MWILKMPINKYASSFKYLALLVTLFALKDSCIAQSTSDAFFIKGKIISKHHPNLWLTNFTLNRAVDSLCGFKIKNELVSCENDSFYFEGFVQQSLPVQIGWLPEGEDQIRFSNIFYIDKGTINIELCIDDSSTQVKVYPLNPKDSIINTQYEGLFLNAKDIQRRYDKIEKLFYSNYEEDIGLWLLLKDFEINGTNSENVNLLSKSVKGEKFVNLKSYLTQLFKASLGLQVGHKFPFEAFSYGDSIKTIINLKKITLVEFWATWCGPCLAAIPSLRNLQANVKYTDFGILGIALERRDEKKSFEKKLEKLGITWYSFVDWDGLHSNSIGIREIPDNLLLAQDGTIMQRNISVKDLAELLERYKTR